jgi:hypothetical protein
VLAHCGETSHTDGHRDEFADGEVDEVERVVGDVVGGFRARYYAGVLVAEVAGEGTDEELESLAEFGTERSIFGTYGH